MQILSQLIVAFVLFSLGLAIGYILRKFIAQHQKNSVELTIQKQLLDAKAEAQNTILEAKTKASEIRE